MALGFRHAPDARPDHGRGRAGQIDGQIALLVDPPADAFDLAFGQAQPGRQLR